MTMSPCGVCTPRWPINPARRTASKSALSVLPCSRSRRCRVRGVADSGVADSGVADSGVADSNVADGGAASSTRRLASVSGTMRVLWERNELQPVYSATDSVPKSADTRKLQRIPLKLSGNSTESVGASPLRVGGQSLTQLGTRTVQTGHNGADRHAKHVRDLAVGVTLHIGQVDRGPEALRQLAQRLSHLGVAELAQHGVLRRRRRLGRRGRRPAGGDREQRLELRAQHLGRLALALAVAAYKGVRQDAE